MFFNFTHFIPFTHPSFPFSLSSHSPSLSLSSLFHFGCFESLDAEFTTRLKFDVGTWMTRRKYRRVFSRWFRTLREQESEHETPTPNFEILESSKRLKTLFKKMIISIWVSSFRLVYDDGEMLISARQLSKCGEVRSCMDVTVLKYLSMAFSLLFS
ncbi:hypothetical protein RCL_jg20749.t1 [Rhizophagus clarus]|uniref:Uncharacterized protein n=1 Tax=Rhizophagus clarus TaxID=94130 RepID=A0A8H3LJ40_9GLOM|nr:hypothetical protein RCL_jg20749.t1 [Rhizophagus clarus]